MIFVVVGVGVAFLCFKVRVSSSSQVWETKRAGMPGGEWDKENTISREIQRQRYNSRNGFITLRQRCTYSEGRDAELWKERFIPDYCVEPYHCCPVFATRPLVSNFRGALLLWDNLNPSYVWVWNEKAKHITIFPQGNIGLLEQNHV